MVENGVDFQVRLSEDRMSALLDCITPADDVDALALAVDKELSAMGVANPPARVSLKEMLAKALASEGTISGMVVAAGRQPVEPVDGAVKWTREFFSPGFAVDEKTGAINYRQRAANLSVTKDQVLAEIQAPKPGQDGCSVLGEVMRARQPKPVPVTPGANVVFDEEKQEYKATENGRIRLSGRFVAVDNVYELPGNVGLASGDIKHPGSIVIKGDVEANATVEVDGDIEVYGTVEAANLTAGGSVTVRGGVMNGQSRLIKTGGSLHASFILDYTVEADGDVVAEKEIVQSAVKARGSVQIPAGRVVGGEILALGGIVAGQVGSEGAVKTLLAPGTDYLLDDEVAWRRKKAENCLEKARKVNSQVRPLMAQLKLLSPSQREKATELLAMASDLENTAGSLTVQADEMETESRSRAFPRAVVNGLLHQDTVFRIRRNELRVKESCRGPLVAVREKQAVVLRPLDREQDTVKTEKAKK